MAEETEAHDIATIVSVCRLSAGDLARLIVVSTDPRAALAGVLEARAATMARAGWPWSAWEADLAIELARRLRTA